jgi:hypothetical protein
MSIGGVSHKVGVVVQSPQKQNTAILVFCETLTVQSEYCIVLYSVLQHSTDMC